jgi:DNA-binding beta-propeller fold protein YncE
MSARIFVVCVCLALLEGCSGGAHSSAIPPTPGGAANGTGTALFKIDAPQSSTTSSTQATSSKSTRSGVKPQYLSPATQAIVVGITGGPSGTYSLTQTAGLTTTSSNCTSTLASTVCTLSISGLAPCNASGPGSGNCYTASLTTYDSYNSSTNVASGNILSTAQAVMFAIVAGETNTIDLSLSGVPASTIVIPAGSFTVENSSGGYDLMGQGAQPFVVESLDADSNIIIGPGAPTYMLATASNSLGATIVGPTTTSPNSFGVTPPTTYSSSTASLTLTPSFTGQATNGCAQSGANCNAVTVAVDMVPLIYVANYSGPSTVTYYNASGTEEGGFSNGIDGAHGIAYDPANGYLYVANDFNSTVTYYNTSGTEEGSYSDGFYAVYGITYDAANGYLYVDNYNNTVMYYSASGTEEGSFAGGFEPWGIAYDAANGYLYVVDSGNNTVTYYNASGTEEGSFSSDLDSPIGIADDPANGYLYVTNYSNSTVTYYNANGTEEGNFSNGIDNPYAIAYDPANGYLYVANYGDSTVAYYNASGTEEGSFSLPNGLDIPFGIAVVP